MGLKPVFKEKSRYIAFAVESEGAASEGEARDAVLKAVLEFCGVKGFAGANPKLVLFDAGKKAGVLKCERGSVTDVRAALFLLTEIGGRKAAVRVSGVSGTIRKLKQKSR